MPLKIGYCSTRNAQKRQAKSVKSSCLFSLILITVCLNLVYFFCFMLWYVFNNYISLPLPAKCWRLLLHSAVGSTLVPSSLMWEFLLSILLLPLQWILSGVSKEAKEGFLVTAHWLWNQECYIPMGILVLCMLTYSLCKAKNPLI